MTSPTPRDVRVACVQMRPDVGDVTGNRARSLEFLAQAADDGADLIVLPELTSSGYQFDSRIEAQSLAEDLDDSATLTAWLTFARARGVHVVAGIAERDRDSLFNTSVVIGPDGLLGRYRKTHLWNNENTIFEPGDLGFPVFDTPLGRISTVICYDGWFPETYRACALRGADIVCVPTNWVPMDGHDEGSPAMATILTQAAAHTNSIFIAAADRVGVERGQPFIGKSVIVDCNGALLAGPASGDREEIVAATLDLARAKASRTWNEFNDPIADRRPAIYGDLLDES